MITTAVTGLLQVVMPKRTPQPTGACPGAGKKTPPNLEEPGDFACNDLEVLRVFDEVKSVPRAEQTVYFDLRFGGSRRIFF